MNRQRRCVHCRRRFVPHPRVKTQRFCSNTSCQKARKAKWQRAKMATDPDYQANQRDAQHAWQTRHPDYWRQYRLKRADYQARNRLLQTHRDHTRRAQALAKMDASASVPFVISGVYHLIPAIGAPLAKMDVLAQKYHVIPIT
jgi:hypothetical protein